MRSSSSSWSNTLLPPRFVQLFLLAALVLLLPSWLYLSRPAHTGALSSLRFGSLDEAAHTASHLGILHLNPAAKPTAQGSQGEGPDDSGGHAFVPGLPPALMQTSHDALHGKPIMAKLGNETAKAELGRATWKFLHTMTLRFPDVPTASDREALVSFFHLFSRLYPCGECAEHFQQLLKDLPPQTSSRLAAAGWLCAAHNRVNARLGKPEFPCDKLDETYDCGCGPPKNTSKVPPTLLSPAKAGTKPDSPPASEDWGEGGKDYVPHRAGRPLGGQQQQ